MNEIDLESIIKEFSDNIAIRYSINKTELWNFLNGNIKSDSSENTESFNGKCIQPISSGKNKGKICGAKASVGKYCKRHSKIAMDIANLSTITQDNSNKKVTKTQAQMIELLNSAVPKKQTVLKKCSKGLYDQDSEFVFDNDFNVIGKYTCPDPNKRKITKLNRVDIEKCEQHVWNYLSTAVENE